MLFSITLKNTKSVYNDITKVYNNLCVIKYWKLESLKKQTISFLHVKIDSSFKSTYVVDV